MKCVICGKEIEKSIYTNDIICSSKCFTKHYWLERVNNISSPNQVVINGCMYQIDREDACSAFRGFDGEVFFIEFNDGRIVKTTNLWSNGKIPEEFRDRLKDNAHWLTKEEYENKVNKEK